MPIYEYRCSACGKISSHLVLNRDSFIPVCMHCGGTDMKKLVSRVNMRLSEETRMERLADPALFGGIDENESEKCGEDHEKDGRAHGRRFRSGYGSDGRGGHGRGRVF